MFEKKPEKETKVEKTGRKKIEDIKKIFEKEKEKPTENKKIEDRLGLTNVNTRKRKIEESEESERNEVEMLRNRRIRKEKEVEKPASERNIFWKSNLGGKRRLCNPSSEKEEMVERKNERKSKKLGIISNLQKKKNWKNEELVDKVIFRGAKSLTGGDLEIGFVMTESSIQIPHEPLKQDLRLKMKLLTDQLGDQMTKKE